MRLADSASWTMSVDRWDQSFDVALWFRAAERIDVSAAGVVPGPPAIEPLPDRSTDPSEAAELAEQWLAWWHALVGAVQPSLLPPDFPGLRAWPTLARVVAARWEQAFHWHNDRKRAGLKSGLGRDTRNNTVVREAENAMRRKARPFALDLVLLPVQDNEIRQIAPTRHLIPEQVYDAPNWPDVLRTLVTPIA